MTIQTTYSFCSLFTVAVLSRLWNIENYKIVQEGEVNSKDFFIRTSEYTLENMVHEYERRFSIQNLWPSVQNTRLPHIIEAYVASNDTTSKHIEEVVNDLISILIHQCSVSSVQAVIKKYTEKRFIPSVEVIKTMKYAYKKILTMS